jgi:hypothetical protein
MSHASREPRPTWPVLVSRAMPVGALQPSLRGQASAWVPAPAHFDVCGAAEGPTVWPEGIVMSVTGALCARPHGARVREVGP